MNEAVTSCCEAFNNVYQIRMVFPLIETQSVRAMLSGVWTIVIYRKGVKLRLCPR